MPQFHPSSVGYLIPYRDLLPWTISGKKLCLFLQMSPAIKMHWWEHFYILGRKGFPQQELLLQELLGKKGHLLSSGCVIKNIAGLEGQEGSRREQRPGLENNRREKCEGKGWSTPSSLHMTHPGCGHAGTSWVILLQAVAHIAIYLPFSWEEKQHRYDLKPGSILAWLKETTLLRILEGNSSTDDNMRKTLS